MSQQPNHTLTDCAQRNKEKQLSDKSEENHFVSKEKQMIQKKKYANQKERYHHDDQLQEEQVEEDLEEEEDEKIYQQKYRPRGPSICIISTCFDCVQSSFINEESRTIAQFSLLTLLFLLLEFVYAILAHSLTLLIDADHRLCDMTGLVISLIVIYVKKVNQHKKNPGWFIRNIESLSGLCSALILQSMALSIFFKSTVRLMKTTSMMSASASTFSAENTAASVNDGVAQQSNVELDQDDIFSLTEYNVEMIVVSIAGLMLNLLGLYLFQEDGENGGEEDGGDVVQNQNHYALYLHILADTLGSFGALLAAFLVRAFELYIADTICAILTAITIFVSVIPLLKISWDNFNKDKEQSGSKMSTDGSKNSSKLPYQTLDQQVEIINDNVQRIKKEN